MGVYIIAMIKIGAVTFVIEKAIKVAGKQDFADAIKLAGFSLVGVQIIGLVKYVMIHPPKIYYTLKTLGDGIVYVTDGLSGFKDGILNILQGLH